MNRKADSAFIMSIPSGSEVSETKRLGELFKSFFLLEKKGRVSDKIFKASVYGFGLSSILILLAIFLKLFELALPIFSALGLKIFFQSDWNPAFDEYGILPFIYGTLVTSFLALLVAGPISICGALFLTELASKKISLLIGFMIEMLAAIPSVVYGLWGLFVLVPWMREDVQPFFQKYFSNWPLFQGPSYGIGVLTASLVLSIMVAPTICSVSREIFRSVPVSYKEAALALGATRWESIRIGVLKSSGQGIVGALLIGLGRALGETMAVAMVIGNRAQISASLFAPAQTMASAIANEYAEAGEGLHLAALGAVGIGLFAVSFATNLVARSLSWKMVKKGIRT